MLEMERITVQHGALTVLKDVSFSLAEGQWLMVVGPNGAGKSTLVRVISREVLYRGRVRYQGKDIQKIPPAALAREIGFLSQDHQVGYGFSVEEVVRLGRYAYEKPFSFTDVEGERKVEEALEMTGMASRRDQSVLTLSGGELQRVFLAQVFAQDPRLLVLDEPTNHLDLRYQREMFEWIEKWMKTPGRAVISVVHDLTLAKAYGTHAMLLQEGRGSEIGQSQEVLSGEKLESAYGMDVQGWMRELLAQWTFEKME